MTSQPAIFLHPQHTPWYSLFRNYTQLSTSEGCTEQSAFTTATCHLPGLERPTGGFKT